MDLATLVAELATAAATLPTAKLSAFVGAIEAARFTAFARLAEREPSVALPPQLVGAAEMARRLDLSTYWVQEAARRGRIPSIKRGRYTRFDPDAVVAALKGQDVQSCAPRVVRRTKPSAPRALSSRQAAYTGAATARVPIAVPMKQRNPAAGPLPGTSHT